MICAAALVLLLDASASIQATHWELQTAGHAEAFEDERLHGTIERGSGVAVTALAFGDRTRTLAGWQILRTGGDARRFAQALRVAEQGHDMNTNIGQALMAGLAALGAAPCQPDQEVIDLITDGLAQEEPVRRARAYAEVQHVRINAIGVGHPGAAEWLREHAVTHSGFAMQVEDWAAFAPAIRSKVTMELAAQ